MISIPEDELQTVVRSFGNRAFSTYDFILKFQKVYPDSWLSMENHYGKGGAGAGQHYSAYSRVAQVLNKLSKTEYIVKLEYRNSPSGWGHPQIRYWAYSNSEQEYPDEIQEPETVAEGAKKTVVVNKYERDPNARLKCINRWGHSCVVCDFNFEEVYGDYGADYIHVHHLIPLSKTGGEYQLNPIEDLRPVCPNCHAMIHKTIDAITIEQLKTLLKKGT